MADWRQKLKTITSADGASASERAKRAGMLFLAAALTAVTILTLIIAFGLFKSGSLVFGTASLFFGILSAGTAAASFPSKQDAL